MELPNGDVLVHAGKPYDPKKAHEYYLRTRELKGRKKGQFDPKVANLAKRLAGMSDEQIQQEIKKSKDPAEKKLIGIMLGNRQKKQQVTKPKVTPEQKQAAAHRVVSIRSELADLHKKLKDALAKSRKSAAKAKRGPTKADKSKQAREAKKYRDKNKQKLANKRKAAVSKDKASGKPKADSVDSLKKQIAETKGRLAKAVERQKALG